MLNANVLVWHKEFSVGILFALWNDDCQVFRGLGISGSTELPMTYPAWQPFTVCELENGPVEIVDSVDLPSYKMGGSVHSFLYVYQAGYMVQEALKYWISESTQLFSIQENTKHTQDKDTGLNNV